MEDTNRKLKPTTVIEIALRAEETILRHEWDERRDARQGAKRTAESLTSKITEFAEIVSKNLPTPPATTEEERAITQAWNTLNALKAARDQAETRILTCQIEADAASKSLERAVAQTRSFFESVRGA